MGTDAHDLRVVDVDPLGRGIQLPQRVDGRVRDEAMSRRRRDRAFGEADHLVVVMGERHAHQRPQPVRLGGDRDDCGPGSRCDVLLEGVAAELHDADDSPVELEAE